MASGTILTVLYIFQILRIVLISILLLYEDLIRDKDKGFWAHLSVTKKIKCEYDPWSIFGKSELKFQTYSIHFFITQVRKVLSWADSFH
jgi:hypothetical protein